MFFKKIISLILCVVLVFSLIVTASAVSKEAVYESNSTMSVQYIYINQVSTSLTISSNGVATAYAYLQKTPSGTSIQLTSTLQRNSGGSWVYVTSWSTSSNSLSALIYETYQVSHGTYRVATNYSVTGDGGTESGTVYSQTVTY